MRHSVQQVRIAHCRVLGDCAELLNAAKEDFAVDCEALMQIFTAMSQRLTTLELARLSQKIRGSTDLSGDDDLVDGSIVLQQRVDRDSFALSTSIKQVDDVSEQERFRLSDLRLVLDKEDLGERDSENEGTTERPPVAATPLQTLLPLLRGDTATKINRKGLGTVSVHLSLSLEGGTPTNPGAILARKKDGTVSSIPLSNVQRVYRGAEQSETLHKFMQKTGDSWAAEHSDRCISFYAGPSRSERRTYDFICSSAEKVEQWINFLDPSLNSSSSSSLSSHAQ